MRGQTAFVRKMLRGAVLLVLYMPVSDSGLKNREYRITAHLSLLNNSLLGACRYTSDRLAVAPRIHRVRPRAAVAAGPNCTRASPVEHPIYRIGPLVA